MTGLSASRHGRHDSGGPSRATTPNAGLWGRADDAALGRRMRPYGAALGAVTAGWLGFGFSLVAVGLTAAAVALLVAGWRATIGLFVAALAVAGVSFRWAESGLTAPSGGRIDAWVMLVDDPRPLGTHGLRATVRAQGKRFEARAYGRAAGRLRDVLAGERILVSGTVTPTDGDWHRWRHVVGRITVNEIHDTAPASPVASLANTVRRTLANGAAGLSRDDRALFTGMVFGDDREQSDRLADDFRAAGLGHLLVVSGQNVAFVLALASPLACRMRPAGRLLALLGVLGVFAMLTRFEPSVLRAVAMAAVGVGAAALGRQEAGRRALAWAIALVVMIDPFLVHQLAFQLSVCATAGILWITPRLSEAMPGPLPLRLAVATTAGAQIAVMPLLIAVFGTLPVASLPANVLAGPAAGPIMMWGLTGGLAAGIVGGHAAWLAHLPTEALMWWVRTVAAAASGLPPAVLGKVGGLLLGIGVAMILLAGSSAVARLRGGRILRLGGIVVVVAVLAHSVLTAAAPPQGPWQVQGASLFTHRSETVVTLDNPGTPRRLLEALRTAGVRDVSLIVAADGDVADAHAVLALLDRYGPTPVVAPPLHRVPTARTVTAGAVIDLGDFTATVLSDTPRLEVQMEPAVPVAQAVHS